MTTWLVVYVVASECFVMTLHVRGLSDAATLTEQISRILWARNVRPESLTVTGPYSAVHQSGIPLVAGDTVVRFGDDEIGG